MTHSSACASSGAPTPDAVRHALRDVVSRSIYGIDINPMALELAKVNLWLEAVEPGRPLNFLDHHLACGNALLGATPVLLADGIPDEAFKPLTGDDRATVTALKKRNREERSGQHSLFTFDLSGPSAAIAEDARRIASSTDESITDIDAKAHEWSALVDSDTYRAARFAADLWCAAFVAPKRADMPAITQGTFEAAQQRQSAIDDATRSAVDSMSHQYGFLHWHLAFPDVDDGSGERGFDVILGNPPWEKVQFTEREFFASRAPEIAAAAGAKRKALVARLETDDPVLWAEYQAAFRGAEGEGHFLRASSRYPLCGLGRVNTYAVFAEAMRDGLASTGRLGLIVPTGIATDDTTKHFFADCVDNRRLISLYDFENAAPVFPAVHRSYKFCLLTIGGTDTLADAAAFAFFAHTVADLGDPERNFTLTPEDLALINPNTRTAPVFRTLRDAELTKQIYRRVPVLVREGNPDGNPWSIEFQQGLFNMTSDSHLFRSAEELAAEGAELKGNIWRRGEERWLPLYEAKMTTFFDHRAADVVISPSAAARQRQPDYLDDADHEDAQRVAMPSSWVHERDVEARLDRWPHSWMLGFANVTSPTNARSVIPSVIPRTAVGHSFQLVLPAAPAPTVVLLGCCLSSFILDYVARQKLGGVNLSYFLVNQFPVPPPRAFEDSAAWDSARTLSEWIAPRALELTYTATDLRHFASDLGYSGPPFRWDTARRESIRAEIDAAFMLLYGVDRDDAEYVMNSFPIVRRKDEAEHGEFRTKRLILERYDAMSTATAVGAPYDSPLAPGPADPACAHSGP